MWRDPGTYVDIVTEFVFNGCNFMLGYMVAQGQIINASKGAWLVAGLTGLVGAANHLRALRKQAAAIILLALSLTGCVAVPLDRMTAEQLKEVARIKDAGITCISLGTPWGRQSALFISVDKGVITSGSVIVDPDCKASVSNTPAAKP